MSSLYADVTGLSDIENISVSMSHNGATSVATIDALTSTLDIGDSIDVDIGYSANHARVFRGYVKQIDRKVPENIYTITAHDVMTRAVDFFVASTNPEEPFSRTNISAEDLVEDVLALAGLTNYDPDPTNFVFATNSVAEVNLVSAFDYCRYIADTLTWHLYADEDGVVHFINRKPYVMVAGSPESNQPGFQADTSLGTINDTTILDFTHKRSEKDLRNRIVVYGSTGIYAEAKASSPYLPAGFYKTVAFGTNLIDHQGYAQQAADYNLIILNRLTEQVSMNVIGDPSYMARSVFTIDEDILGINDDYYIVMAEHSWSKAGYTVSMELRK